MKIYRIHSYELNHKLREPSRISYQSTISAKNVLVLIETNENIYGIGESAPFKPSTGDTQKIALKFLKLANDKLKGEDPCNIENIQFLLRDISKKIDFNSQTAKTAIDSACYDILGRIKKKPVYKLLSNKKPKTIPNTITVYIRSIEETIKKVRRIMNKYRKSGICRVKLKLSGNPKTDKKRVLESAKIFPGEFTLDANEAYKNADLAIEVFNDIFEVLGSRVVLIEQPSPRDDLKKLEYISKRCKIPIFSDETVATLEDLEKIIERKLVKGVNIKLQRAGGIFWAKRMAELAKKSDLDIMVGCVYESGIAISQDVNFLAGISEWACGSDLDTDYEIERNPVSKESRISFKNGGRIPLNKPGLGLELEKWVKNLMGKNRSY